MHAMDANTSNVPAFITKLWKLVEDITYDDLICWNQNGRSFIIHDQSKFAKELLPLYFKHSNMASFIRQLNMYGFRKVSNIENSGLRSERDDIEFFNQFFVKGQEYALEFIKRKMPTGKSGLNSGVFKQEDVSEILTDIESMKGKQESVDSLLTNMQRENEALWREVAILRQKHHKQQQIVEKLLQFLVSLVQNRGILGIKRKAQLMIDHCEENNLSRNKVLKPNECDFSPGDSRGPIIHDVTDDLEEGIIDVSCNSPIISNALNLGEMSPNPQVLMPEVNNTGMLSTNNNLSSNSSEAVKSLKILDPLQESIKELGLIPDDQIDVSNLNESNVEDNTLSVDSLLRSSLNTPPGSPSIMNANIFANENTNVGEKSKDITDLVVSTQNNDQMRTHINPSSLTNHVDGIEAELDWLQDQLGSGGLNIDSSTLLGVGLGLGLTENSLLQKLFSMEDMSSLSSPTNNFMTKYNNNEIIGNEVVQFNPNNTNLLFDDLDLDAINPSDDSQDQLLLKEELLSNLSEPNEKSVSFTSERATSGTKQLS